MHGTHLYLCRHAETAAPEFFHGAESDIGLSDWGRKQAAMLGAFLRTREPRAVYSSAMARAVATGGPVAEACGLVPVVVPELHERKIGPLSGLSREDGWKTYAETKSRWMAGDLEATHEGGESFLDIRRRVLPFFEALPDRHPGEAVAVIAHGVVIRVVLLSLLEPYRPTDFDRIAIDFAAVNELSWNGSHWDAAVLNRVVAPSPAKPVA